ncbi:MAG TPA: hypothetical protein VMT59_14315 [Gaiellaceae bacterium]|nr:hypothetical protein [Gaiellaceae bacterium]
MRRFMTHRILVAGAVAVVTATSVAVAIAATTVTPAQQPDGSPMQLSPSRGNVPLVAASPSEIVSAIAERLPLVSNAAVVTATIPGEGGNAPTQGLEVTYDLNVQSTQGPDITQALWEGDMLVGAVADEYAAGGFGQIITANATLVTPDGQRDPIGGGVGKVVRDQSFNAIPANIESTVTSAAKGIGLGSVRVETITGLQDAIVIHAVSNTPASTVATLLQRGGTAALLGQASTNFEGTYLEIDDTAGSPVYIAATAPRDGSGTEWTDPSLGLGSGDQLQIGQSG